MLNFGLKHSIGSGVEKCTEPVAVHTSATSATGTVSASSEYGAGYEAWRAFDGVIGDLNDGGWFTKKDVVAAQIVYEFTEPRKVTRVRFFTPHTVSRQPKLFTLDTSDDGVNWVVRKNHYAPQHLADVWTPWYVGPDPVVSKFVRVNVVENWGDPQYTHIPEIEMDLEIPCP